MNIFDNLYKNLLSNNVLSIKYLDNYILDYLIACIIFIVLYIVITGLVKAIIKFTTKIAKHKITENKNDDNFTNKTYDKLVDYLKNRIHSKIVPFEIILVFFLAINFLNLTEGFETKLDKLAIILVTFFLARLIIDLIKYYVTNKSPIDEKTGKPFGAFYLLLPIIKIVIWIIAFFFAASNLGYDITVILGGIGIGGIAIALASQSFLSDILSYLSIISDKPFELGDYIAVAGVEGNVVKIGIKSVRILSFSGEEVVVPNAAITSSKLQNFRKLEKRRVELVFQVTLDVPNDTLEKIPAILKQIVEEKEDILEFNRSHFAGFSDFGYIFNTIYYVLRNDYLVYMNLQQYVNLRLRQELDKLEVNLAYPTKDIRLFPQDSFS